MKPLSLEFTAFGSYPGTETVDFTSLADLGLYVVTGPTGSGKTTIFDAMAYALYGEVPGERDKGDVRSQHADAGATCSVAFRFAVEGIEYRVERTPEQLKPRKRGGGSPVKETAKASLVRESDGVALASGATKVAKACVELVGLDAKQFERVILLPQGRFQQFLLADTATRLPLLRQLFGTGKWLDVVEELKAQANVAKSVVADIEEQLRQHQFAIRGSLDAAEELLPQNSDTVDEPPGELAEDVVEASTDELSDELGDASADDAPEEESLELLAVRLDQLEQRIAPLEIEERRLAQLADRALSVHTEALAVISAWDKRVQFSEERRSLDELSDEITKLRTTRDAALSAEPVLLALEIQQRDSGASRQAAELRAEQTTALREASQAAAIGDFLDPDLAADALVVARAKNNAQRISLTDLANASELLGGLQAQSQELETERDERGVRAVEIDNILFQRQAEKLVVEALAATEPECALNVEKSGEVLQRRRDLAEIGEQIPLAQEAQDKALARQREAIKAFDDSAAPRLAESLVDGEACPVCGSLEHPSPASSGGESKVNSADRDAASTALMDATQELLRLGNRQHDLVESLGNAAKKTVDELGAEHAAAQAELASALDARRKLEELHAAISSASEEKSALTNRLSDIYLELAGLDLKIEAAASKRGELRAALGELASAWDVDAAGALHALDVVSGALDSVDALIASCRTAAVAATTADATATVSASALENALSASSFASVEEAKAVALDQDTLLEITETVEAYETRNAANQTLLAENLKLELPTDRPDATDLELAAHQARSISDAASTSLNQIMGHLEFARTNLNAAVAINEGSGGAFERSTSLQSLAKTCDGQGPKRIALETWVLAGELERVAAAANHHLGKMTNGRYQIERSDDSGHGGRQSGLDLRVLDAHTGSSRRPGSLSGGEQFQASLALALGLADVIGHGGNANGRVFEALFVDEGFGSLDPDSLDQAVNALTHIQAGGRTVGVITHVEAMKESLAMGIRVDRLPNGKGSTLTVRPNG